MKRTKEFYSKYGLHIGKTKPYIRANGTCIKQGKQTNPKFR